VICASVTGPQARVKSMVKVMWSMRFIGWWCRLTCEP
jgi:hypothetical protein